MSLIDVPPLPRRIGLLALVPLFLAAAVLWLAPTPDSEGVPVILRLLPDLCGGVPSLAPLQAYVLFVQLAYAACLVSFFGAAHWGFALAALAGKRADVPVEVLRALLLWSVVPAAISWAALLMWAPLAVIVLMLTAGTQYALDRHAVRFELAPFWYLDLRAVLAVSTVAALLLTFLNIAGVGR